MQCHAMQSSAMLRYAALIHFLIFLSTCDSLWPCCPGWVLFRKFGVMCFWGAAGVTELKYNHASLSL